MHVETAEGWIVDARCVVFCTGYELVEGLELPHHRVESTGPSPRGALLPTLEYELSHTWAGAFGESPTGLPLVDRVPGIPGAFLAAGSGGNGITHSVTAAEVVRGWIAGRADPDASLYRLPAGNG